MQDNVVFMYHDIISVNDTSSGFRDKAAFHYKILDSDFEQQVKSLVGKDVCFSFDDGGVSAYTIAAPILEKYGFKGMFFVCTKYIDTPGFLSSNQIKDLAERGHIVASHSHSHPDNMTKLTESEMLNEWKQSVLILSRILGQPVMVASIPNGYESNLVYKTASASGITTLYNSIPTTEKKTVCGVKAIGRYVVYRTSNVSFVNRIVDRSIFRLKLLVRATAINIVRYILADKYDCVKSIVLHHAS